MSDAKEAEALRKLPTSREAARELGVDRYFTGVPCKHGHIAARYVSTTNCVSCQLEHARRNGGWQARPSKLAFLERVRDRVAQRGGVLLSSEYISAKTKLRVLCGVGHEFEATSDNLKSGTWCPDCKREQHSKRRAAGLKSVEELREFVSERYRGTWAGDPQAEVHSPATRGEPGRR